MADQLPASWPSAVRFYVTRPNFFLLIFPSSSLFSSLLFVPSSSFTVFFFLLLDYVSPFSTLKILPDL